LLYIYPMIILNHSDKAAVTTATDDPINIFCQFFLPRTEERITEIRDCLRRNVENAAVTRIYLLNERIYTTEELGVASDKIVQVDVSRRLRFSDVFDYIASESIAGYNVIVNSDIFVDETIDHLRTTTLHTTKSMMALLRYEWNNGEPNLFGPRMDSQDTWIVHSAHTPTASQRPAFAFEFGKPGCDNKLAYLFTILGYTIINDPALIRTYHAHREMTRDYTIKDRVDPPYAMVIPYGYPITDITPALGVNLRELAARSKGLTEIRHEDNLLLHAYIKGKLDEGHRFLIPRIAGIENNFAIFGEICKRSGQVDPQIAQYFAQVNYAMKNNAGVLMTSQESIMKYSDLYVAALDNAELIGGWELYGTYYPHIRSSYDYVRQKYQKPAFFWTFAMDIFHYIHGLPWTHALRGQRLLIVSAFADSINEMLEDRAKIYGVDLFPGCTITTIKPPQTQAAEPSREFDVELAEFCERLDAIKGTYDVALVACGGYGNLVCNHIYTTGHSAIYVGGVLQMYFGILGERWLRERPDIVTLYLNEHWRRPKDTEKPRNFQAVEGSCYW
jgi:hypothetical protein